MQEFMNINGLTFSYENNVEPLFEDVTFQLHQGWTAVVGANGSGKTTLLKLLSGILKPDFGAINYSGTTYYSEQRTDFMPDKFTEFLRMHDKPAYQIKNDLQIQEEWQFRWASLSHGERKRCQIATALSLQPRILAIDEPTNHLDQVSKNILLSALKKFSGLGLLVSHDRKFMDELGQHTLFITPTGVELRRSIYSIAALEMDREENLKIQEHELTRRKVKAQKRKVAAQRVKAEQAEKLKSKKTIHKKDHDAKAKKDLARLTGKDGLAGKSYKKGQSQLNRLLNHQQSIKTKKTYTLGITFSEQKSARFFPITIVSKTLTLGKYNELSIPDLSINFGDKIGISGINGSGKSTFIQKLVLDLNLPKDQLIYIPQEIPENAAIKIVKEVQAYDRELKGKLMIIISRLGSDPKHILETNIPSPGEIRKLMLAEGLMKSPSLIVMDEPTNHLDLASIQCMEDALNECTCAQLLVSHDQIFLNNIVNQFWRFETETANNYQITRH